MDCRQESMPELFISMLRAYLLAILPGLFSTDGNDLIHVTAGDTFREIASRFATEGQQVLYVFQSKAIGDGQFLTPCFCASSTP